MKILQYLRRAVECGASDIFVKAGSAVKYKLHGVIRSVNDGETPTEENDRLINDIYTLAKRDMTHYEQDSDDDFSFSIQGLAHFRVNAYRQRGSMAAVIRIVAFDIMDYRDLHIPEEVMALADVKHGMVLITGAAGSGKSTTQACIIDRINNTRNCHVITLEDPIEHLHQDRKSIITQREINIDTRNFITALRACLRQAPDVILLGEMRDHETIRTAMTAAETGHFLIATLHTSGTVNTIDRIIDSFPPVQQAQIRMQLSSVLHTVVFQQLIPAKDGSLLPAYEIMHMNNAIRNMIRDNKTYQIDNAIDLGKSAGMISMDQFILNLYKKGLIDQKNALDYAMNADRMKCRICEIPN